MTAHPDRISRLGRILIRPGWSYHVHWRTLLVRMALILAGAVVIVCIGFFVDKYVPQLEGWIRSMGVWAPVCFIALFVITTPFFAPNSGYGLISGALFGLWHGLLWVVIAAVIAASLIFWITRLGLRDRIDRMLAAHPRLLAVRGAVLAQPIRMMLLLRLSPVPFTVLCYMLSVSRVRYRDYMIALVGFVPGNFVTVYAGFLAGHVARLTRHKDNLNYGEYTVAILGLIACVILTVRISKAAHRAVDKAQAELK